jgi:hypothetical protein
LQRLVHCGSLLTAWRPPTSFYQLMDRAGRNLSLAEE